MTPGRLCMYTLAHDTYMIHMICVLVSFVVDMHGRCTYPKFSVFGYATLVLLPCMSDQIIRESGDVYVCMRGLRLHHIGNQDCFPHARTPC